MTLSVKTRFLNRFRLVFQIPGLERGLRRLVLGKPFASPFCKLVPPNYLYPQPSLRRISRAGLVLDLDISDYIDHGIYFGFLGTEEQSYRALTDLIQSDFNCIDVGANNGFLSLLMAKAASRGKVVSFEPYPRNYSRALGNVALNTAPNLVLLDFGLGSASGTARMPTPLAHNSGGCRIALSDEEGVPVAIKPLDECFAGLGLERLDLVKIDVEGFELNVLRGATETLLRHHPLLFVEVDDANLREQGDSASALLEFLREAGYVSFVRASDGLSVAENLDFGGKHFDLIASPRACPAPGRRKTA